MVSNDTGTTFGADDSSPAAESLALIEAQRREVRRQLRVNPVLTFGPWGVAYLLGFGSIFLVSGTDPVLPAPGWVVVVIPTVLFVAASVVSGVHQARTGRGIHGPSQTVVAMYGFSWTLGLTALVAVNLGVSRLGLSTEAMSLLWSGSLLVLVGVLVLAGAALCRDRFRYGLGAWMLLTGAGSVFAGVPGNFAVLSLAGGGGLLAAPGYFTLRRRTARA